MPPLVQRVRSQQEVTRPSQPLQVAPSPTAPNLEPSALTPSGELLTQSLQREPLIQREPSPTQQLQLSKPSPWLEEQLAQSPTLRKLYFFAPTVASSAVHFILVLCMILGWITLSTDFSNTNFFGLYKAGTDTDSNAARSHTGFIIKLSSLPLVTWISKIGRLSIRHIRILCQTSCRATPPGRSTLLFSWEREIGRTITFL